MLIIILITNSIYWPSLAHLTWALKTGTKNLHGYNMQGFQLWTVHRLSPTTLRAILNIRVTMRTPEACVRRTHPLLVCLVISRKQCHAEQEITFPVIPVVASCIFIYILQECIWKPNWINNQAFQRGMSSVLKRNPTKETFESLLGNKEFLESREWCCCCLFIYYNPTLYSQILGK